MKTLTKQKRAKIYLETAISIFDTKGELFGSINSPFICDVLSNYLNLSTTNTLKIYENFTEIKEILKNNTMPSYEDYEFRVFVLLLAREMALNP